jgi:hypothetical protein
MQFYVTPEELSDWISETFGGRSHWLVAWQPHSNIYTEIECNNNQRGIFDMFSKYGEQNFHLYVGKKELTREPIFNKGSSGMNKLNFLASLCISIIPSFYMKDTLLEGQMETLRPSAYRNDRRKSNLFKFRFEVYRSFKKTINLKGVVPVQVLANGHEKEWRGLVVSPGALAWHTRGGKLKQFFDSPVEITLRRRNFGKKN